MKSIIPALAAVSLLAACAETPASSHIAEMQALTTKVTGLQCPSAQPTVVYGDREGAAYTPAGPMKGGTVIMPARFDPTSAEGRKAQTGPQAHWRMAEEVAHTCGANETQARAVKCQWWICG
ncbi:hypothetical protein [Emcibacter sp. SYSU 3D8]|uniref:hypothetical protein n=1 Tax=Emcibacter sp. SYSU 3D8 TaxID=3133969 RepID=UPI0031FF2686